MTVTSDLGNLLADLRERAPAPGRGDASEVGTLDTLHGLSSRCSQPLTPDDRAVLEALCRKLGVAGRVWAAYDAEWRRPASRAQLTGPEYALLGAVLLACASSQAPPSEESGVALKLLNAAFGALDVARNSGDGVLSRELDEAADRVLGQLLPAT
jgi:hypothetical protein